MVEAGVDVPAHIHDSSACREIEVKLEDSFHGPDTILVIRVSGYISAPCAAEGGTGQLISCRGDLSLDVSRKGVSDIFCQADLHSVGTLSDQVNLVLWNDNPGSKSF